MDSQTGTPNETAAPVVFALRDSIGISTRSLGGKKVIVLQDDQTGKFYHLGPEESVVVSLLDGSLAIDQVAVRMRKAGIAWNPEDLQAFISMLVKFRLATAIKQRDQTQSPIAGPDSAPPRSMIQIAMMAMGLMLSQRIPLGSADSLAARLMPWVGLVYTRSGLFVWSALVATAFWIAFDHRVTLASQCEQMFAPESLPLLACLGVLIKVIHEIGHAVAAKRHGVRVGSVGITLFMFAPLAYVDLTNAWKLKPRWPRVQIALGGVYLESWLAIIATFLFASLNEGLPRHLMAQVMMIAGPATWLINANPLMRLDGYYALSDALSIPNLRMHGRKRWLTLFDHWLLGEPVASSHLHGWRLWFSTVHAAMSVLFQCFWMTGLLVAVSSWAGMLGMALAAVAVLAWVVAPCFMWWLRHWNANPTNLAQVKLTRRKMMTSLASILLLVSTVLSARNPFTTGVPVVVQHREEQVGRASADGFVTAVLVRGNQCVQRGDLLVEVTDEDLVLQRDQMRDDLQVSIAKYRQFQSAGLLAEAEAANETAKQLQASIGELDQAVNSLQITAQRNGVVVSEQPERWLGRHVKRGEVLVRVADPDDKELLIAIEERNLSSYNAAVNRGSRLAARIRGGKRLQVEPAAPRLRFSNVLPHPALAATSGGDIPVTSDAQSPDGVKAAIPLGSAIATVSPIQSLAIRAGQRGTLYLEDDQTIYSRLKYLVIGD